MSDTTKAATSAVVTILSMSLEEKKAALKAKLEAEIASTGNWWVKCRNSVYLALINTMGEALLTKMLEKYC